MFSSREYSFVGEVESLVAEGLPKANEKRGVEYEV